MSFSTAQACFCVRCRRLRRFSPVCPSLGMLELTNRCTFTDDKAEAKALRTSATSITTASISGPAQPTDTTDNAHDVQHYAAAAADVIATVITLFNKQKAQSAGAAEAGSPRSHLSAESYVGQLRAIPIRTLRNAIDALSGVLEASPMFPKTR